MTNINRARSYANILVACVVSYVLQAEPTIRIIFTACRLAQSLRRENESASKLPVLDFWLSTLHKALDEDDFWGPDFWKDVERRASRLEAGIYQMAFQCCEMEKLVRDKPAATSCWKEAETALTSRKRPSKKGIWQSARYTINATSHKDWWMQNIVIGCWTILLADAAEEKRRLVTSDSWHRNGEHTSASRSLNP